MTGFVADFGLQHPLVQAPMAGGATTPELVAAVSNAGALGSFAAAVLSPQAMLEGAARIRALTAKPFNVNLFVLDPRDPTAGELARAQALLDPIRAELGIPVGHSPARWCEDPREQLEALIEISPPVASFAFGVHDRATVSRLKKAGSRVIGAATNVAEARAWEAAGADAVCAQGAEAGGHRGTFIGDFTDACIGTMALVPALAAAVKIPVLAAGGIMDGRGIAAALALGAQAAQLGTAFLCCTESAIPEVWKRAVREARDDGTRLTRAFSGRYARGVINEYMNRMRAFEHELPAYPVMNALSGDIRAAAAKQGRPEYMSLWAGQGAGRARTLPAADLVAALMDELQDALRAAQGA